MERVQLNAWEIYRKQCAPDIHSFVFSWPSPDQLANPGQQVLRIRATRNQEGGPITSYVGGKWKAELIDGKGGSTSIRGVRDLSAQFGVLCNFQFTTATNGPYKLVVTISGVPLPGSPFPLQPAPITGASLWPALSQFLGAKAGAGGRGGERQLEEALEREYSRWLSVSKVEGDQAAAIADINNVVVRELAPTIFRNGSEELKRRLTTFIGELQTGLVRVVNEPCVIENVQGNILELGEQVDAMIVSHNDRFKWAKPATGGFQPSLLSALGSMSSDIVKKTKCKDAKPLGHIIETPLPGSSSFHLKKAKTLVHLATHKADALLRKREMESGEELVAAISMALNYCEKQGFTVISVMLLC